jgi:hypothetical protein
LEELPREAAVKGILPDSLVTVVDVKWIGTVAVELTYKAPSGSLGNELLYRDREPMLEIAVEAELPHRDPITHYEVAVRPPVVGLHPAQWGLRPRLIPEALPGAIPTLSLPGPNPHRDRRIRTVIAPSGSQD